MTIYEKLGNILYDKWLLFYYNIIMFPSEIVLIYIGEIIVYPQQ